ncbi:MAG: peptidyl-alpha-hydroxyglycine alpha-amidating lyase family protein [Gammaproteobacteria bacterium]
MTEKNKSRYVTRLASIVVSLVICAQVSAQGMSYSQTEGWAQLPEGFEWGQVIAVDVDADGNVYAFHRCSSTSCVDRDEPPLLKFDSSGQHLMSWGSGMLVWPHGLDVDAEGNVWITDGRPDSGRGEQVIKIGADGEVLMTVGTAGVAGDGHNTFDGVSDVEVAANGNIFVADGHGNNRIVKFSPEGEFITEWGTAGSAPGEFNQPHALAMDSEGRLFVADRENLRIQIFDQDGNFIDAWSQFGRVSGISISADDTLYVAAQNDAYPEFETAIYVVSAKDGAIKSVIGDVYTESVAADSNGSVYTGIRGRTGEPQVSVDALQRFAVQ